MAKRNLKIVESDADQEKLREAIFEAQTCFWQIETLTKTLDMGAMESELNFSDTDKANIAGVINMLATLGNDAMQAVEERFHAVREVRNG